MELPLDRLIRRANDPRLDENYRDMLCVQILPYFHRRLPNLDLDFETMTEAQLDLIIHTAVLYLARHGSAAPVLQLAPAPAADDAG
jgi:hypothetical protein